MHLPQSLVCHRPCRDHYRCWWDWTRLQISLPDHEILCQHSFLFFFAPKLIFQNCFGSDRVLIDLLSSSNNPSKEQTTLQNNFLILRRGLPLRDMLSRVRWGWGLDAPAKFFRRRCRRPLDIPVCCAPAHRTSSILLHTHIKTRFYVFLCMDGVAMGYERWFFMP